jgi:membrane fusion protein, multidrug efflux system
MRATLLLGLLAIPAFAAPPVVAVIKPAEREVFDHEDVTGRTEAGSTVEIRSRLAGYVDKVQFKDGAAVKKGELLLQLDDRVQRAELDRAQAEHKRAEAGLKRAEADLARTTKLVEAKAVTAEDRDKTAAVVEEAKATLLAVRAGLEVARLNLEFTRISAPIDGRIGRANATAGNLVRDADVLASLYALDPLYVVFELDERTALRLLRYERDRRDAKVTVGLAVTGDEGFPREAGVDFIDPSVDPKTGALRVRAVLPNPKEEARPGQFVRVRVPLGDPRKAVVIPETALGQAGGEYFVLVVNDKNVLERRPVRAVQADDNVAEVQAGLKADDRVVRDQGRHRAGDEVKPQLVKEPPTAAPKSNGPKPPGPARPLPELPGTGPALVVTGTYPGANAHAVEETVAAPIDAQVNGLEKMTRRVLACSDDGTMRLTLLFEEGTDLNVAQVQAQDRIALALPKLPEVVVRQYGITVKKRGVHLSVVAVVSPNDRYDRAYLANYAKLQLRDELARVPGVADATFYGDTEPGKQVRLVVDRERMAALGLTTSDVANALREQGLSVEVPAGSRHLAITLTGRLADPGEFKDIVIKAGKDGQLARLGAVARVEMVEGWGNTTAVDGKPAATLLVSRMTDADPKATAKALRDHLATLTKALPEGVEVKVISEP